MGRWQNDHRQKDQYIISIFDILSRKGSSIRQNLNENFHLAHTQFYHLPGFYPNASFLRNHSLSLSLSTKLQRIIYFV